MIKTLIFLLLFSMPLSATSAIITASNDYSNSAILTDPVVVNLDFGTSGRNLDGVIVDLTFNDNLYDPGDSIEFVFKAELLDPDGRSFWLTVTNVYTNTSELAQDYFNSDQAYEQALAENPSINPLNLRNLYVDDNGLASFVISSSFIGNGLYISEMLVTAELKPVPLPGAFLLFISGMGLLTLAKRKYNKSNTY